MQQLPTYHRIIDIYKNCYPLKIEKCSENECWKIFLYNLK